MNIKPLLVKIITAPAVAGVVVLSASGLAADLKPVITKDVLAVSTRWAAVFHETGGLQFEQVESPQPIGGLVAHGTASVAVFAVESVYLTIWG